MLQRIVSFTFACLFVFLSISFRGIELVDIPAPFFPDLNKASPSFRSSKTEIWFCASAPACCSHGIEFMPTSLFLFILSIYQISHLAFSSAQTIPLVLTFTAMARIPISTQSNHLHYCHVSNIKMYFHSNSFLQELIRVRQTPEQVLTQSH